MKFLVRYVSSFSSEVKPEIIDLNSLEELLFYVEYTVKEECIIGLNPAYGSESPYSHPISKEIKWRITVYDGYIE